MLPPKALGAGPSCLSQHRVAGGCRAPWRSRLTDTSLQSLPTSSRLLSLCVSVSTSLSKAALIHWDLIYKDPVSR